MKKILVFSGIVIIGIIMLFIYSSWQIGVSAVIIILCLLFIVKAFHTMFYPLILYCKVIDILCPDKEKQSEN